MINYKVGDKVIMTCFGGLSAEEVCLYTGPMASKMAYLGTNVLDDLTYS
jgi:hypothetical protein